MRLPPSALADQLAIHGGAGADTFTRDPAVGTIMTVTTFDD